jgi:hypothetical protein
VHLYANNPEHEPAQIVAELPKPTPPLGAISIVRVFRSHPEFLTITAVYDAADKYRTGNAYWSQGGEWLAGVGEELSKENAALHSSTSAGLEKYGLPATFPIADYLENSTWAWKDIGQPNVANVIHFHYDYNRWVRQDQYDSAGKLTTRYLTYVVTPEDRKLEALDRLVPFNERR